ncbi:MAG: molybdopterin molybdotransferase MoeA [Nitrospirae bacterium]|nr:molybdopterin molybdotransferase MoeA [Nitrospirota bacterium]
MLGREEVLSVEDARGLIFKSADFTLPHEIEIRIENSLNRILSRDIVSHENLPPFARSTVDGFAVRASDTFGAAETAPAYLSVTHEILMGEEPAFNLAAGDASGISTGGMLPKNADAVVMLEHCCTVSGKLIEVLRPAAPGENVIQAGEDCKSGDLILKKGHGLRPQDIGVLAGTGIIKVWIYEKPVAAIISTGDEVAPPSGHITTGKIRDINSYVLAGMVETAGGTPVNKGIFPDNFDLLKEVLEDSFKESDLIIISGGSSVGAKDLTARLINSFGKPGILFHGVSVKPGKPIIYGIANGRPVFGLPGHPVAITVCFELFILPVLMMLTGEKDSLYREIKKTVRARLSKNISTGSGREEHIRVMLEERDGEIWAVPVLGKSGLITTLVKADGMIMIPLHKTGLQQGAEVDVELF